MESIASPRDFSIWLTPLYQKEWVVYAKPPWNGPQQALKYLARYTHRVAIANQRLVSMDNGQVTFRYKDYRHQHRQRTLTLSATEFMRRFMMHVVPRGFMRIRYYGFLANTHRDKQLDKIRKLLGAQQPAPTSEEQPQDCQRDDPCSQRCPNCNCGTMWPIDISPRPRLSEILEASLLVPT